MDIDRIGFFDGLGDGEFAGAGMIGLFEWQFGAGPDGTGCSKPCRCPRLPKAQRLHQAQKLRQIQDGAVTSSTD